MMKISRENWSWLELEWKTVEKQTTLLNICPSTSPNTSANSPQPHVSRIYKLITTYISFISIFIIITIWHLSFQWKCDNFHYMNGFLIYSSERDLPAGAWLKATIPGWLCYDVSDLKGASSEISSPSLFPPVCCSTPLISFVGCLPSSAAAEGYADDVLLVVSGCCYDPLDSITAPTGNW